jgi:glycogen debranching enzyme
VKDPAFVPTAYHDGQVWTIATAWAARAAFAMGDGSAGVAMLRCNADRIIAERGFANECYRGDRPEPFNSCFLLGFSIAPFLTCLFEGLWGMKVGPGGGSISIEPRFPAKWTEADLSGVRIGTGHLDLAYRMGRLIAHWSGPETLEIRSGDESMVLAAGGEGELIVPASPKNS